MKIIMLNKCFKNNRRENFELIVDKRARENRVKEIFFYIFNEMSREINLKEYLLSLDKSFTLSFVLKEKDNEGIIEIYEVN